METLRKSLEEVSEQKGALQAEVSSLQEELAGEKKRVKELWKVNCMQLSEFDAALTAKEEEIQKLQEQLALSHRRPPSHSRSSLVLDAPRVRQGRRRTPGEIGE